MYHIYIYIYIYIYIHTYILYTYIIDIVGPASTNPKSGGSKWEYDCIT